MDNLNNEDLKAIRTLLEEQKAFIDKKEQEAKEKAEIEAQEKLRLDEAQSLQKKEDEKILLEKEKKMFEEKKLKDETQNNFMTGSLDNLKAINEKLDTYQKDSKSDGVIKSVGDLSKQLDDINLTVASLEEPQEQTAISYYADLSIVFLVFICLPVFLFVKLVRPFLSLLL